MNKYLRYREHQPTVTKRYPSLEPGVRLLVSQQDDTTALLAEASEDF